MSTTSKNKAVILKNLQNIERHGLTNISLGTTYAFEVLKHRKQVNIVSIVFILSDALDTSDQDRDKNSLKAAQIGGDVSINAVGFGNDHDPNLMTDIASLRD